MYLDDASLVAALRQGDETAFTQLVERYHAALLRLARLYVNDTAAAEDVVQETWLGLLRGLDRFEGRASLKTWLFRILVNRARTRAVREARQVPFSSLAPADDDGPAVDPSRFHEGGGWAQPPQPPDAQPENRLLAGELRGRLGEVIDTLPEQQRTVILLRDVGGLDGPEVAEALGISEGNQRVILHRARSKVRAALEEYLTP
jgi:RNA polymerase sigma-70 factor (ECF subfamily)